MWSLSAHTDIGESASIVQHEPVVYRPFNQLPLELTTQIFKTLPSLHRQEDEERGLCILRLRAVCRAWRDIAEQTPTLWKNIPLDSPNLTNLFLRHSLSIPISIAVKGHPASPKDVNPTSLRIVLSNVSRAHELLLFSANDPSIVAPLRAGLALQPALNLESLQVIDSSCAIPNALFNNCTPQHLRLLRIHGNIGQSEDILRSVGSLLRAPHLTTLDLQQITVCLDNQTLLIDAIQNLVGLRKLTVCFLERTFGKVVPRHQRRSVSLPRLETVFFEAALPELIEFASIFVIPPESELTLSWHITSEPTLLQTLSTLLRQVQGLLNDHFSPLFSQGFAFKHMVSTSGSCIVSHVDGSFTLSRPILDPPRIYSRPLPRRFTLKYRLVLDMATLAPAQVSEDRMFQDLVQILTSAGVHGVVDLEFIKPSVHRQERVRKIFDVASNVRSINVDNVYPLGVICALGFPKPPLPLPNFRFLRMRRIRFTEIVPGDKCYTTIGEVVNLCLMSRLKFCSSEPLVLRIKESCLTEKYVRDFKSLLSAQPLRLEDTFRWDGELNGLPSVS
ncbi:hypothetical protein K488DRAFT_88193 [Vararia minispora EC-137]|uniref:Uncharacterized protein n=1 Tax=Vararia minispora EC-137 TaxID=1314806 RepID=A0ACB8QEI5_9AGAM|nr:hypothetical protein K488DRAFT_88193 [Vararia minispora EC-137]